MNLNELREAMASDATKENERLRSEINLLRDHLHDSKNDYEALERFMTNDCLALANRCWALTHGTMCCFCRLDVFKCPHSMGFVDKLREVRKIGEENSDETGDL